eukprot:15338860-Alexandrium_andersonii.AAC.1
MENGAPKLFDVTADNPDDAIARGNYVLSQLGLLHEHCTFLIDGYVSGGAAVAVAEQSFSE